MADRSFNILSLCTGIAGLDLGVELAVPGARTVCGVEREAYCVEVLARRMEEEALAPFPVWSDLRTFDGRPWRGVVDCVVAGYPCQPFSVAGKRRGADDPRHLWPHVARIIGECGAPLCFLENVGGHLRLGAREVIGELHAMGYRTAAGLFTAEEVGASHKRERLFILGALADSGKQRRSEVAGGASGDEATDGRAGREPRESNGHHQPDREGQAVGHPQRPDARTRNSGQQGDPTRQWGRGLADAGDDLADAEPPRRGQVAQQGAGPRAAMQPERGGEQLADASLRLVQEPRRGPQERDGAGPAGPLPCFPPGPGDIDAWRRVLEIRPDLAPATQPEVRGVAHGPGTRMDQLRALGNGVVPLQAAHAFRTLAAELLT